jgi:protein tyrosine phosphatase
MIKQNIKIITEGIINKMIPSNKNFLKTKTSTILNIDKFVKIIKKNPIIKKKIVHINNLIKKSKNKNYQIFINEIFKTKIIEDDIKKQLLEDYFSSKKVIKVLKIKTQNFLKKNKKKNINNLLQCVKKSKLIYKNV